MSKRFRKMKSWNWLGTGLCMLLIAALLAACSGKDDGAAPGQDGQPDGVKNPDPVELIVYSTSADSHDSFNDRFGNAIRDKFPHITLNYIRKEAGAELPDLMTAGTPVDLYFDSVASFFDNLINFNLNHDLADLIRQKDVNLGGFDQTMIEFARHMGDGKLYALPVFNNSMTLYYNKDLFDKFGVNYPRDGMNWDEAHALAERMNRREDGVNYVGLVVSPAHIVRMNQYSLPYVDGNDRSAINNPLWARIYTTMFIRTANNQVYKDKVTEINNPPYRNEFLKGEVGMFGFLSNFLVLQPDDLANLNNWDLVSLPTMPDKPGVGPQSYPTYFAVTSVSRHKEAAMDVLKFLVSEEYQMAASRKGVMTTLSNDAIKKAIGVESRFPDKNLYNGIFYNSFAPMMKKTLYDSVVDRTHTHNSEYIRALHLGGMDINTALREMEEKANLLIQAEKAK